MSPPDSPTLVNRNRKLADSASSRMSDAAASTAPAATPFTEATTGWGMSRRLRVHWPVMRANSYTSLVSRVSSSPMMSSTSPPEQKPRPLPRSTSTRTSSARSASSAMRSRMSAYTSNVSELSRSGRENVTVATPSFSS